MPPLKRRRQINIPGKGVKHPMMEQALGLGLSLVIWVGSTVGMIIGYSLKPFKWLRKSM